MNATHSNASNVVKHFGWTTKPVANYFTQDEDSQLVYQPDWDNTCILVYPEVGKGWIIQVSFVPVIGHPDMMRIRAANYRAEDEPNGLYSKEDAWKFYLQLLNAGLQEK